MNRDTNMVYHIINFTSEKLHIFCIFIINIFSRLKFKAKISINLDGAQIFLWLYPFTCYATFKLVICIILKHVHVKGWDDRCLYFQYLCRMQVSCGVW